MKILLADDDGTTRLVLGAMLENLGHEVLIASDGEAAWELLQEQPVTVLLTDWNMPRLTGPDLCRRIRAAAAGTGAKYTYVILLTMLRGKNNFLEGMEAGADDFITKPWDEQLLAVRLRVAERLLSLRREVHELSGLLPICSYCKSIRDDKNYWEQVETYVSARTDARFSHGICPDCYSKHIVPQFEKLGIKPGPPPSCRKT